MKLPKHLTLSIEHNTHKNCYTPLKDYLFKDPMLRFDMMSIDEVHECLENDEIWEIQWYPHTPIGFHYVCGPTLQNCLDKIENKEWD